MIFGKNYDQLGLLAPSALVAVVGIILTAAASGVFFQNTLEKGRVDFTRTAGSQLDRIENTLESRLGSLTASAALFQNVGVVEANRFNAFAGALLKGGEGIRSLGWVPYITKKKIILTDAMAVVTSTGPLTILERDSAGMLRTASVRSEYFPVIYSQPLDQNVEALGLDFGTDPILRAAIEDAWATGKAVATPPIRRGADATAYAEVYVFAPVYDAGTNQATLRGRTQGIKGFALMVLDATPLVQQILEDNTGLATDIYIYDVAEDGVVAPIYSTSQGVGVGATYEYLGLTGGYPDKLINVNGRVWHVLVKPAKTITAPMGSTATVFIVGLLLTALLSTYIQRLCLAGVATEQAVQRGKRDLKVARKRAHGAELDIVTANKAKATFLATMSHELRTPLTGVLGYIELLCAKVTDPEHKQLLDKLWQAANAQRAIVNDVLDYSRISAGTLTIEKEPFRLLDVVDAAISTYGTMAKEKGVFVGSRTIPGVPVDFIGDPSRLQQVVNNLVSNAVKFTKKGSVTLHVGGAHVDGKNYNLELSVQDTGIGITTEQMERLFEPFVHTEDVMTRPFGGTGLGLSICREITQAMGGTIQVESEVGWGSKFVVNLPLPITDMGDQSCDEQGQNILFVGVPLRILIVEDYCLVREMLTATLSKAGHVLVAVDNGSEAYEAIYSPVGEAFDLIIMDMHMPIMDGAEATKRIRKLEKDSAVQPVPIIGISADIMSEHIYRFKAAGINAFVSKPIDWKDLGRVIQKVMRQDHEETAGFNASRPVVEGTQPLLLEKVFADFVATLTHEQSSDLYDATIKFFKDCTEKLEQMRDDPDFLESKRLAHSIMGGASTVGAMKVSADAHNLSILAKEPADLKERITKLHDLMELSETAFDEEFRHVCSDSVSKSLH